MCDAPCDVENISFKLSLGTDHIGKGCDRDTYSVESQRKLCGKFDILFDCLIILEPDYQRLLKIENCNNWFIVKEMKEVSKGLAR